MKKFYLILPIMIFILGCSQNTDRGVGLSLSMHNLGEADSRVIDSQDLILIDKVEIWVLPEGAPKPTMNTDPDKEFLKTPGFETYTAEDLAIGYIELEVNVESIVNIWIRVDTSTNLGKVYVGNKKLYISPNTDLVNIDIYETDTSLLNSDAEEWNDFIQASYYNIHY